MFKSELLKAQMVANGMSVEDLADKIGINPITLYRKMSGKTEFTRSEMQVIKSVFRLNKGEMDAIFFG